MDLNTAWFLLVGFLIVGYAILDGYDLGVGVLYFYLGKTEAEKKLLLASIGPYWDANEVWLITGGAALFAAFPVVYASVFSGFYLAMMLVLMGLIMRAISVEFRGKVDDPRWKKFFGYLFFLGSFLPAILLGVAVGNIVRGIPLNLDHYYIGGFWALLNPYALLFGILGLLAFIMQGCSFILWKTEGDVQQRAREIIHRSIIVFAGLYLTNTVYTYALSPRLFKNYFNNPLLFLIPTLVVVGLFWAIISINSSRYRNTFLGTSLAVAGMILTLAVGLYPNLVPSTGPGVNLTIYNAASSLLTLKVMLIIALLGLPLVFVYTFYIYKVFKGKTDIQESSY